VLVLFNNEVDHAAQEGDVRAGTKRHVKIAAGGCSGVTGIDVNDGGAFFFRPLNPLEGDGMVLCGIAAHDQYDVRIL